MNRGSGSVAPCAHSDAAGLQATLGSAWEARSGLGHELSEPDTAHPTVMLEVLASCGRWVRRHPAGLYSSTERQSADRMLMIGYSWASARSGAGRQGAGTAARRRAPRRAKQRLQASAVGPHGPLLARMHVSGPRLQAFRAETATTVSARLARLEYEIEIIGC